VRQNRPQGPRREWEGEREQEQEHKQRKKQGLNGKELRQSQDLMNKKEKSNTEHEENAIVANEINKMFGLQKKIDQSILNQKNSLMANTRGKRFEVGISDKED
jgi:hypothetical protein